MSRVAIVAPLPGVFYRRPSADEAQFVKDGETVHKGDTVCLIEVMKMYFEVQADHNGIFMGFNLESGDIVEAGQEIAVLEIAGE